MSHPYPMGWAVEMQARESHARPAERCVKGNAPSALLIDAPVLSAAPWASALHSCLSGLCNACVDKLQSGAERRGSTAARMKG